MTFKPTSVPTKRLSASITSTQMTFKLDDIIGWNGVALTAADFGTQGYGVFRNGRRDLIEIFEFDPATIASASITIVRRGLNFNGDRTTEIAGNKLEWTAGDTFVDLGTDTPQLWQYLEDYINDVAISGAPQATTTVKGIVEMATLAQLTAGTPVGETGANLAVSPDILAARVKVRGYKTTTTNFPASYAKVVFDAESFDVGASFDIVAGTFTCPRTGYYQIGANANGLSASSSTARGISIAIYKNGTIYSASSSAKTGASSVASGVSVIDTLFLTAGDTIEIYGQCSSGEFNASAGEGNMFLTINEL